MKPQTALSFQAVQGGPGDLSSHCDTEGKQRLGTSEMAFDGYCRSVCRKTLRACGHDVFSSSVPNTFIFRSSPFESRMSHSRKGQKPAPCPSRSFREPYLQGGIHFQGPQKHKTNQMFEKRSALPLNTQGIRVRSEEQTQKAMKVKGQPWWAFWEVNVIFFLVVELSRFRVQGMKFS